MMNKNMDFMKNELDKVLMILESSGDDIDNFNIDDLDIENLGLDLDSITSDLEGYDSKKPHPDYDPNADNGDDTSNNGSKQKKNRYAGKKWGTSSNNLYNKGLNTLNALANRKRQGLPTNPNTEKDAEEWITNGKNPYNKVEKDNRTPTSVRRMRVTVYPHVDKEDPSKDMYYINIYNLYPEDVKNLLIQFANGDPNKRVGSTQGIKIATSRENNSRDAVTFKVRRVDLDTWLHGKEGLMGSDVSKVLEILGQNEKNTEYDLNTLRQDIERTVVTDEYKEKQYNHAYDNSIDIMKSYLENSDDPEIRHIISIYQRSGCLDYICKTLGIDKKYGYILSLRNAMAIRGYGASATGKNPTFLLPEKTWHDVFHRDILPNAKVYYITIPGKKNENGVWRNRTAISYRLKSGQYVQLSSTDDIISKVIQKPGTPFSELTKQERRVVNTIANQTGLPHYFKLEEYDVSDTVWDQNLGPDVFNEEPGLVDSLLGTLNKKGEEDLNNRLEAEKKSEEELDALNTGKDSEESDVDPEYEAEKKRTEYAYENISEYCDKNKIRYMKSEDHALSLVSALLEIYKIKAKDMAGQLKDSLQKSFADVATHVTLILEGIALDQINSFQHKMEIDKDEVKKVLNAVIDVIRIIEEGSKDEASEKKQIAESVESGLLSDKRNFVAKALKVLKSIGITVETEKSKQLKESFFATLEKWDNAKTNLKY